MITSNILEAIATTSAGQLFKLETKMANSSTVTNQHKKRFFQSEEIQITRNRTYAENCIKGSHNGCIISSQLLHTIYQYLLEEISYCNERGRNAMVLICKYETDWKHKDFWISDIEKQLESENYEDLHGKLQTN